MIVINTMRGAQASAIIYSVTETARANNLNVYYYSSHLLAELPQLIDLKGNMNNSCWSRSCHGQVRCWLSAAASAASEWRFIGRERRI